MDDNIFVPAAAVVAEAETPHGPTAPTASGRRIRFTSNVVGTMFLVTDIICFVISAPITLAAYSELRGQRVVAPVHITAFILMLGSFLLIRSSRHAYRRSLLDLGDHSDTTFDAGSLGTFAVDGDQVLLCAPIVFKRSNIDRFNLRKS